MKRAYIVNSNLFDVPVFMEMRNKQIAWFCANKGYDIIGGTDIEGQMTDEIKMQIVKRIEAMLPDVVVLYSGLEFGCESSEMHRTINHIRYLGAEVDSMWGLLPDVDYMSVLDAVSSIFADLEGIREKGQDMKECDGQESGVGFSARIRTEPYACAKHWNSDRFHQDAKDVSSVGNQNKRCIIYVKQNPDFCNCDAPTMEEQREQLRQYAMEKGYDVCDEVQACERSQDKDGVGLQLLKKVIVEKGATTVLIRGCDVLSEDALLCGEIVDDLKRYGVDIDQMEEGRLQINANDFFQMR